VRWLALDNIEAPDDDLRHRAAAAGATIVARGEGLHMRQDEVYACSPTRTLAITGPWDRFSHKLG
jgi:secreted PhoX family phosphatase